MTKQAIHGALNHSLSTASTVVALALVTCSLGCKKSSDHAVPALNTDQDKVMYSLGIQVGQSLRAYNLTPLELELVKVGLEDSATGKEPKVDPDAFRPKLMEIARARQQESAVAEKARGKAALDKAAAESGAERTPSGLVFKMLRAGTGPTPTAEDTVKVHYEGRLTNGTVFDSSYKRNQPTEFPLRGVVKCWTEGLQKVAVGGKAQLTCPAEIAYGERGRPPTIPGNATLVFDVELLEIVKH